MLRYDDIMYFITTIPIYIVYTNTQSILTDFNSIYPNLHFRAENEQNNTINYLDVPMYKTEHNIQIPIYRKPTITDTIIPYTSNRPTQHKYAAIRSDTSTIEHTRTNYVTRHIIKKSISFATSYTTIPIQSDQWKLQKPIRNIQRILTKKHQNKNGLPSPT